MTLLEKKLARIKNRTTMYELGLFGPHGERLLVLYIGAPTRARVADAITSEAVATKLVALTGADTFTLSKAGGKRTTATIGDWVVKATGRTQRDAYLGGELPWIGEWAADNYRKNATSGVSAA